LSKELKSTKVRLSHTEFNKLSSFIYANFGIKLLQKKSVIGRWLQKRLKATQLNSFEEYLEYIFSTEGKSEIIHMIDRFLRIKQIFWS
jgi:chemotaxis protein methyltransferase CheR